MADKGHNLGRGFDAFAEEARQFSEDCGRWSKETITPENAGIVRDLIATGVRLHKEVEAQRRAEKVPHEDAAKAVDAKFRPLTATIEEMGAKVKASLTAFIKAEEERARREAEDARRLAAEEARKAAEAAKAAQDNDPFAAFDASQAQQQAASAERAAVAATVQASQRVAVASAAGEAKAASLRTYYQVEVTDAAALVAHFAAHPEVIAAAVKAAQSLARTSKGAVAIPGCKVVEDRRVA